MELTKPEVEGIKEKLNENISLKNLLENDYPEMNIYILRGYDNLTDDPYTKGTYLSERFTRDIMENLKPNGTLNDTYHIVKASPKALKEGEIHDRKTESVLDEFDISMIYSFLQDYIENEYESNHH